MSRGTGLPNCGRDCCQVFRSIDSIFEGRCGTSLRIPPITNSLVSALRPIDSLACSTAGGQSLRSGGFVMSSLETGHLRRGRLSSFSGSYIARTCSMRNWRRILKVFSAAIVPESNVRSRDSSRTFYLFGFHFWTRIIFLSDGLVFLDGFSVGLACCYG